MKNGKPISLILACLLFSMVSHAAAKVGFVNIRKIVSSVEEGKSVDRQLKKSYEKKQKLLKKDEEEIRKLQESFQKQNLVLSEKAKRKKREELNVKVQAVRTKFKKFNDEIKKEELQLTMPIYERLKPIVESVSKTEKVDMTFEVSTSPVVYAKNQVDLSDNVIKAYNKKYPKKKK